jgi:hypothetical protein
MAVLRTVTLSSVRAFVNQIHCFVASANAIYSGSHVEVVTELCFLESQTDHRIIEPEKDYQKWVAMYPDNFCNQSRSIHQSNFYACEFRKDNFKCVVSLIYYMRYFAAIRCELEEVGKNFARGWRRDI